MNEAVAGASHHQMTDDDETSVREQGAQADLRAAYMIPDLPPRITPDDIPDVFIHMEEAGGFSDMYISSESEIKVRTHGAIFTVTRRALSAGEVDDFVNEMYSINATTELGIGKFLDFSYEVKKPVGSRYDRYRYRVNATAIRSRRGGVGVSITIRAITSEPWSIKDMGVEPEVVKGFDNDQGLILVAGSTGSGKSTLMSAAIRRMLEDRDRPRVILTYEQPIEYVYDAIDVGDNIIYQSEVPRNVKTFSAGVVSAMRRNPDVILVGEARDRETIVAASEAAMTGHLVIATVHANSVAETLRRIVVQFDRAEQDARLMDLVSSMRMIVAQRLENKPKGGRIALREYLIFTPAVREQIYAGGIEQITPVVSRLVTKHGQSMSEVASAACKAGDLTEAARQRVCAAA